MNNKTIISKEFKKAPGHQVTIVRIVYRTGFYSGRDFPKPLYTVAVGNCIQANYETEVEALTHYEKLLTYYSETLQ
jgi:hypothetical protein